jgi:hypothetical protein
VTTKRLGELSQLSVRAASYRSCPSAILFTWDIEIHFLIIFLCIRLLTILLACLCISGLDIRIDIPLEAICGLLRVIVLCYDVGFLSTGRAVLFTIVFKISRESTASNNQNVEIGEGFESTLPCVSTLALCRICCPSCGSSFPQCKKLIIDFTPKVIARSLQKDMAL